MVLVCSNFFVESPTLHNNGRPMIDTRSISTASPIGADRSPAFSCNLDDGYRRLTPSQILFSSSFIPLGTHECLHIQMASRMEANRVT